MNTQHTKFQGDYYKTENLSPDELNARRRNQRGVWLTVGRGFNTRKEALSAAREMKCEKVRATPYSP